MTDINEVLATRGKILGVLLRDARQARGQSAEALALVLGCEPAAYAAYERGDESPSLPELELLAQYLNVPLAHFWGERLLSPANGQLAAAERLAERDRLIGARLRAAREAAGLPPEAVAEALGMEPDELAACEAGEAAIPLPELEALAARVGLTVDHFREPADPAEWDSQPPGAQPAPHLPPELREFVAQPANEPYLRLAQRLGRLSNEQLRGIAEALLEITY